MRAPVFTGACFGAVLAATAALAAAQTPLTLPEAVGIALKSNPALAAAEGRTSGARAVLDRAGAERWPQVRLESRVGRVSEVPTTRLAGMPPLALAEQNSWITSATLQQLVFAGGRVDATVRQAERGAAAARASLQRARQTAAFGAERAFFLLVAAQEETGVAAKNLAAAKSHLRVAGQRLAARVTARFDVLRAEVQAEEALQEAVRADGNLAAARALLLQALGLSTGEFYAVAPEAAVSSRPELDTLLAQALEQRPDLQALARQVEAAAEGVAAARAERLPTLALAADYQYVQPESTTLFSRWSVGAVLSLPAFDGGRAAARRLEAEASLVQARAALDLARRQVEAEVRLAAARAASASAQVQVAERRVAQAEELARLADVRFAGGVGTATELADAKASLAMARYGLVRAHADSGIAGAEMRLAVGAAPREPPGRGTSQDTPLEKAQ